MKKEIKFIIVIFIIILVIYFGNLICLFFINNPKKNTMLEVDLKYYSQMIENENNEITLEKIFSFEWDRAYIMNSKDLSSNELDDKMGTKCNLAPILDDSYYLRIIFINKNECVYQFYYDYRYLEFDQKDIIINPETKFMVKKEKTKYLIKNIN